MLVNVVKNRKVMKFSCLCDVIILLVIVNIVIFR